MYKVILLAHIQILRFSLNLNVQGYPEGHLSKEHLRILLIKKKRFLGNWVTAEKFKKCYIKQMRLLELFVFN